MAGPPHSQAERERAQPFDRAVPAEPARQRPELLAPAGEAAALAAALQAGADAVYFGLSEGFNARARAGNFSLANLAETVALIHRAGARAYLALNTLVSESELDFAEMLVRRAAECGVDALIVQDPAVALIARALCPALEVHASTQMTISSAEGARFALSLGCTRAVAPRELSVEEIRQLRAATPLELEVFVHGALCVAWSGQCLSSATWSGRSANRGECAQSCRLPYELVLDGARRELGDVQYLLSPKDLAGLRAIEQLAAIGVHGLKIEGRQKNAQYVLSATETYRHWLDAIAPAAGAPARAPRAQAELEARAELLRASLAYTRGFSDGFLGGADHQTLVEGRFPKHRGVYLGRVVRVGRDFVEVERDALGRPWTGARAAESQAHAPQGVPSAALSGFGGADDASEGPRAAELEPRAGQGVVFDAGQPEDQHEPGGPIFRVEARPHGWRLGFGTPGPDLARVAPGQRVWISGDPRLARAAEQAVAAPEPGGRIALALCVSGRAGEPLRVAARATRAALAHARAELASNSALARAQAAGLDARVLEHKLAAFGGTPFALAELDTADLEPGLHLPVSELKALRRALVAELLPRIERGPARAIRADSAVAALRAQHAQLARRAGNADTGESSAADASTRTVRVHAARVEDARAAEARSAKTAAAPQLVALCRSDAQLEAAIAAGLAEVELDWMELVGLGRAVQRARAAGLCIALATVRVQKPGEQGYDERLAALAPDAVLVRHWGALVHFDEARGRARPRLHGDFSLNVTNALTAGELFARGLDTLTPAHDLDREQLLALLRASEPARFTLVLQHRMPTFHTEHCVYAHLLSNGRDFRTCGRPCEAHTLALRDAQGREHPVIVDVGCRNTVFNAQAQSAAGLARELVALGVRRFRVEFARETREQAAAVLEAYRELLAGRLEARELLRRANAIERVGLSESMALMSNAGAAG